MQRRSLLLGGSSVTIAALAGCTLPGENGQDGDEATGDGDDPEFNFDFFVDTIDEDLGVEDSSFGTDSASIEFYSSGDPEQDVQAVATSYAAAVMGGVEADLEAVALSPDDPDEAVHSFVIEADLVESFNDGEISEAEYFETIGETAE
ncbi:hypothetical protein [Natrarchaeobaculum aegyptiacum]|uniref:DUF8159 domain-containing protein n=1 Tax=Natrarchaeobaculum aegyptiacum TaxID=745377 RepID=A0A2Z2HS91_9EURY|nr:hypothetical protein [Natrarchaeobaculum aegyptiacum]ARS90066.1 hypothetical protein B1756_10225 [Natrarchaeobaculum aegyptiacum]